MLQMHIHERNRAPHRLVGYLINQQLFEFQDSYNQVSQGLKFFTSCQPPCTIQASPHSYYCKTTSYSLESCSFLRYQRSKVKKQMSY